MSNTLIVIGMLILVSVLSAVAWVIVAAVESKWVLTIRGEEEEDTK